MPQEPPITTGIAEPKRPIGPIRPEYRIEAVDMVRGFALFGVLLVNMYNFGAYSFVWTAPTDKLAFSVMRFFFETKSWRLFSILFGFGFSLQLLRAEAQGARFLPVYLRRLVILFIIGMGHALIYDGDILMFYAELGLILVVFRRVPPKALLVLVATLLMVFPVERAVRSLRTGSDLVASSPDPEVRLREALERIEEHLQTNPASVGSIVDVMAENADEIPPTPFYLRGPESSPSFFAMFLLGLYVGRRRIFHDIQQHMALIRRLLWWGLSVGLLSMTAERILHVTLGYAVGREQGATVLPQFIGDILVAFGSTALSLGYAAAITVLAQHQRWRRVLSPLGAVGRLGLTVYLTQSLMFGTLFYGFAFGQAFRIGPATVSVYAMLFFVIQIAACTWWVRRFRFGPMEWLWRTLTYGKLQKPMRL